MRFQLPSNAGINVAEELFHGRLTVVEDFGSKSALIKIHLSSIDMLVSVTVNSVNKFSSFTTAYLPGKTLTNEVSLSHPLFFSPFSVVRPTQIFGIKKTNKQVMTQLNHFSLGIILLIYLKNDHSNSIEKNRNIFFSKLYILLIQLCEC